ncbi:hypothetical protein CS063_13920 [Sporanaerobium hydrogeniformans]|uniref:Uncharacterized protein n=1 Tax=Sporanaerobium hydrogeniformans TaxID=3072179 RepID=A0AC61DAN9_9FIRM|nr:DUF4878 domain-containing protein [Sporanaerobium hydrogeniformans]PHV69808.1 hypothetical protein CS063_13920 [Sporanaerobium hydrogeniformans]
MEQGQLRKRKWKIGIFLIGILVLGTIFLIGDYYWGPKNVLNTYLAYLKEKKYDRLYELLDLSEMDKAYEKEDIIACYKRLYEREAKLVQVRKASYGINKVLNKEQQAYVYIDYIYDEEQKVEKLELIKVGRQWKVKCPFVLTDLKVYAPIGSRVFIEGREVKDYTGDYYYMEQALPGQYSVKIEFPNHIYSDYIGIMEVPQHAELFLDYTALTVEIKALKGTIVELAGVKQINTGGQVVFKNILEGTYDLKIYHPNDAIKPLTEKIVINKENRCFDWTGAQLSTSGMESLKHYITDFYQIYIDDIKKHSTNGISNYVALVNKDKLLSDFKEWFINNKDVLDARIAVQPKDIKINKEGLLEMSIVETTEVINKEYDEWSRKEVERSYKIWIEWKTQIDMSEKRWKILDRDIIQSMVCYKDEEGRWIQY